MIKYNTGHFYKRRLTDDEFIKGRTFRHQRKQLGAFIKYFNSMGANNFESSLTQYGKKIYQDPQMFF